MLLGFDDERVARLDLCSMCTEMPNDEMAPATNSCLDNDHLRCFMLGRVTLTESFSSHTGFVCATCASVVGCVVEQQELLSTSGIYSSHGTTRLFANRLQGSQYWQLQTDVIRRDITKSDCQGKERKQSLHDERQQQAAVLSNQPVTQGIR
jgi:hypothetical protein